ncbi:MAG: phage portal protein [Fusobacteriaceae bacterium]
MSVLDKIKNIIHRQPKEIVNKGYEQRGSTEDFTWQPEPESPDNDILENLEDMRARSRDLYMNNEIATAILDKYRTKVIGTGLIPKPTINYRFLNITKEKAKEMEQIISTKFDAWAYSTNSDSSRVHDFYTLQSLVQLSWIMNGDVFAVVKRKPTKNIDVELCIQLLEADRVTNPSGGNQAIKGGVEVDKEGTLLNYYISNKHPGDGAVEIKKYPVFNSMARRNILHIFEPTRIGQRRGIPLLSPVLRTFKQLDRYKKAEMMAAVLNASVAMLLKTENASNILNKDKVMQSMGKENEPKTSSKNSIERELNKSFGHGQVYVAGKDEELKEFITSRPNKNYKDFVEKICEELGAATGIPVEVMMSSFKSSYSAAKASLEEAEARFKTARRIIEKKFCQPIYEEFIIELMKNGDIECPNFFDDVTVRYAFSHCIWIGTNKTSLDPLRDAKADEINLRNKITTRAIIARRNGVDYDDITGEIMREEEMLATHELNLIKIKKSYKGGEKNEVVGNNK